MQDLCGFENLLVAFKLEEPEVARLIEMVEAFNLGLLQRYVQLDPDMVALPEDLGMQSSLMISPAMFRKYIAPSYRKLTAVAGSRGAVIHQHSDGWILDLIDELVACGMHAINIQDMVNGIDNIARVLKGRVAIDLDIDRQNITVNGSPREVRELIREEVAKLADPRGGLSFTYQPWAPTPLENVRALVEALQSYAVEDCDQVWRDVRH
jgi:uroporphyrinogen-III decarboxylase